uniref:Uncharacterized protein n=1 Tax=Anguilla anguilla TaxID=7936 RepID=A0A0E9RTI7_ANGAN
MCSHWIFIFYKIHTAHPVTTQSTFRLHVGTVKAQAWLVRNRLHYCIGFTGPFKCVGIQS